MDDDETTMDNSITEQTPVEKVKPKRKRAAAKKVSEETIEDVEKELGMTPSKKVRKVRTRKAKSNGSEKPKREKRSKFDLDKKITVLVKDNPKREGTMAFKRFEFYRSGMTVRTALEKGVSGLDLAWDSKHDFIKIA